jgi:Domain of unknown function (DUF4265)
VNTSIQFALDVEDGWPPVGSESLPFAECEGGFQLLNPPLFVKNLSVKDIIEIENYKDGFVKLWHHKKKSNHSTIWILRIKQRNNILKCLKSLRKIGCNTSSSEEIGCYSVDVPGELSISLIDNYLDELNKNATAIAFPSMRHPE